MAFVGTFVIQRKRRSVAACDNELLSAAARADIPTLSRLGRQLQVPVRTVVDGRGAAAMHVAAEANAAEAVPVLFEIARGAGGATAQYGHDQRAAVEFVNMKDGTGRTPLHYAVGKGAVDAVGELMRLGADARLRDESGVTPIGLAESLGDEVLAAFLCQ